jgi:hypothetical protein
MFQLLAYGFWWGDECSGELSDMYDLEKCLLTRHPLGRVVRARSRWHQQSWWVGSTPSTTRRCRSNAGMFEQMPVYQNLMTEGQLFCEVENSWCLFLCAVTGVDRWLQLWGSQLSIFMPFVFIKRSISYFLTICTHTSKHMLRVGVSIRIHISTNA